MMYGLNHSQVITLLLALSIALVSMFAIDIHLASLPYIAAAMHTNKQHMQLSISVFLLGMGLSILAYGPLSDKYGRKPIVIIGLFIATVTGFAQAYCSHINAFLFWRFLQGVGLGVGTGIGRTIFADILSGELLAIVGSYFSMMLTLSPLFAPIIGGYLQQLLGWQSNFIVISVLCIILLIVLLLFCPESNLHKNPKLSLRGMCVNYTTLLRHPIFVSSTLLTGIGMSSTMVFISTSSFILQTEFDLTPILYGWVTMIAGFSGFLGKLTAPFVIRRVTSIKTIQIGLCMITVAGLWLLPFTILEDETITILMIAVFVAYLGQSYIMPSVAAQALGKFDDKRGAAGALYGGFQTLMAGFGTSIIVMLPYKGSYLLAISYLFLSILGLVIYQYLESAVKNDT